MTVAGDTRFDRVGQIAKASRDLPEIAAFMQDGVPCLIVGSAWEADRAVIVPALNQLKFDLKVIIAPHEIHEAGLARWEETLAGKTLRYSAYKSGGFDQEAAATFQYLIIDNVGMLSSLYRYGQLAYIGGAFGQGLHNILEAATFGLPVLFGNKRYHKFQEAVELVAQGGALAVADASDFQKKLDDLLQNPVQCSTLGDIGRTYVQNHTGATAIVMRCVEKRLAERALS